MLKKKYLFKVQESDTNCLHVRFPVAVPLFFSLKHDRQVRLTSRLSCALVIESTGTEGPGHPNPETNPTR